MGTMNSESGVYINRGGCKVLYSCEVINRKTHVAEVTKEIDAFFRKVDKAQKLGKDMVIALQDKLKKGTLKVARKVNPWRTCRRKHAVIKYQVSDCPMCSLRDPLS